MAVSHWVLGTLLHQGVSTLTSYLETHPVPNCVVIGAERFRAKNPVKSLEDFGVKTVKMGATTAIVPAKMVQFGDVTGREPDLYDGLSRNSKVLYLATTLKPAQWKLATGDGIGLKDLDEAQQRVYRSLLPETLAWTSHKVDANYQPGEQVGSGTLSPNQLSAVRLRLNRQLQLHIYLADKDAYSIQDVPSGISPGGEVILRTTEDPGGLRATYGAELRTEVPTVAKRGDLKLNGLTQVVTLPPKTTIGEALKAVSSAVRLQIQPDARVRNLRVTAPGPITASDFLNICGQSVGGTYRKVGDRYLLTHDVMGVGARAVLYREWLDATGLVVREREKAWQMALGQQGISKKIGWNSDDPLAPNDQVLDQLDRDASVPPKPFPVSQMGPQLAKVLKGFLATYGRAEQKYRDDVADVGSMLNYQFVLPDGRRMQSEGYLGADFVFSRQATMPPVIREPVYDRAKAEDMTQSGLLVSASSPDDAKFIVETAKRFGFGEIWVQTESQETLVALIQGGMSVKLVVRPWTVPYGSPSTERTILGDTGQTIWTRLAASANWAEASDLMRRQTFPRSRRYLLSGDLLSPWDPRVARRLRAASELAATSGLGGLAILDSQVHGYEPGTAQINYGRYHGLTKVIWAFGYSVEARLAFIDQHGIDPIDIVEPNLLTEVNLSTPSFRMGYDSNPSYYQLSDEWAKLRSKKSEELLGSWVKTLPESTLCDLNRKEQAQPPAPFRMVVPIGSDRVIPTYQDEMPRVSSPIGYGILSPTPEDPNWDDFVNGIRAMGGPRRIKSRSQAIIDLASVPRDRWDAVLARAIEPRAIPAASGGL